MNEEMKLLVGQTLKAEVLENGDIQIEQNASPFMQLLVIVELIANLAKSRGDSLTLATIMAMYSNRVGHQPQVMVYDGKKKIFPPRAERG